ncbi:hypothetical protein [Streptomyces sp. NPDC049879]|uniref:hypothetical protein n=1 Tax=Streptomyces sp. NPDC049879 TaxID=3365598 RepID=UPI0037BE1CA1
MEGNDRMDRLLEMMPPSPNAGEEVDWGQVCETWGHGFPSDYRAFVQHYGRGGIEDFLEVLVPGSRDVGSLSGMYRESENARQAWLDDAPHGVPDGVRGDSLIAWGVNVESDLLCWEVTEAGSPDLWPIVIFRRHGYPHWRKFECGMVSLLLEIFTAELGENPLSGTVLWGKDLVRFLHQRDEEALRTQGIDPWTGEPDPFAGMFGEGT